MNMRPTWPLTLYYDGDCPLCAREIHTLRRHASVQRLCLVDISLSDFHPESIGHTRQSSYAFNKPARRSYFTNLTWAKST